MLNIKIDLVYLWVDSNDQNWQSERAKWAKKLDLEGEININQCRYIDNQELRYSLRSAEMYAPWINKIFIITNGQIPKWLNKNHPKIKIIKHSEIMPHDYLPTFNSEAIETCIANIPELSEYFLSANDDKFFASKVLPSDFFDSNGNPIVKMRKQNWVKDEINKSLYKHSYMYTVNLFSSKINSTRDYSKYEPIHCIEAYRKSYFLECKKVFSDEFHSTGQKRFRLPNSVQHPIVDMYMVEEKGCYLQENISVLQQDYTQKVDNLYLTLGNEKVMEKTISEKKPKLLCINDGELVLDVHRKSLKELLESLYPIKQNWEVNIKENTNYSNSMERIFFAFNKIYLDSFLANHTRVIKNHNPSQNYELNIINTDLSEQDKILLQKIFTQNYSINLINLNKISNKSPYMEEIRLTTLLASHIHDEKLVFWGASIFLENFINQHAITRDNILGIVDINPHKHGEHFNEYKIFSPNDLKRLQPDKIIVTIINATSSRINEIKDFLNNNSLGDIKVETL